VSEEYYSLLCGHVYDLWKGKLPSSRKKTSRKDIKKKEGTLAIFRDTVCTIDRCVLLKGRKTWWYQPEKSLIILQLQIRGPFEKLDQGRKKFPDKGT